MSSGVASLAVEWVSASSSTISDGWVRLLRNGTEIGRLDNQASFVAPGLAPDRLTAGVKPVLPGTGAFDISMDTFDLTECF